MLVLMMLAAVIVMVPERLRPHDMLATIETEAARLGVAPDRLARALTAPERRRSHPRSSTLYCLDEALTKPGDVQRICRSREDWAMLGFEPVAEA